MPGYGFSAAAQILDIPESRLRYWAQIGFVGPSTKAGGKQVFTFRDLIQVRAARELIDRGFSTAHIRKVLRRFRPLLPEGTAALEKLRVAWDGETLVLDDAGALYEPSGQRMFDFGLSDLARRAADAEAVPLEKKTATRSARVDHAMDHLSEGLARLATDDLDGAFACFSKALALDAGLAAVHTNLAVIYAARGDRASARAALEKALSIDPQQAEARYDLATLLLQEDADELAVAELKQVLQQRPDFADAHFNIATALERLGSRRQAREHLLRFLELVAAAGLDATSGPWIEEARRRVERLA